MDLDLIATTLGLFGIGVGAIAWLARRLLGQLLDRDIEGFKANLKSDGEKELERLRSSLELAAQKQIIEYGSLHTRRATLITELYEKLENVHRATQVLLTELQIRGYREESEQSGRLSLDTYEEEKVTDLSEKWRDMSRFYRKNKIFFDSTFCALMERFETLTGFISVNYGNVALKDKNGNLYVNPDVKRVWDASYNTLPEALSHLEIRFRSILGVE